MKSPTKIAAALLVLCGGFSDLVAARDPNDPYWEYRDPVDRGEFDYDDSGDVPWQEAGTKLPPLPHDAKLHELPLDEIPAQLVAYTELDSVVVGKKDAVTRYWLVIKGSGGGYNATFEGLRCNTGEYKIYAYGNPGRDPQVKAAKDPQWRPLQTDTGYRRELAKDIFCAGITPKTTRQIRASVRGEYDAENPYAKYID